jgi:hypothetical protein
MPTETVENKVFDINGLEIFKAGTWKGDPYTNEDLDNMVKAHNEVGGALKPYLKLGHDPDQKLLQTDGYPAAGWVTNLRREGDRLLADLKSVPARIKELIDRKAYGRVSSEIYWNLKHDGKTFPRALRAVALLGGDTPQVKSIQDMIGLYDGVAPAMAHTADGEVRIIDSEEKEADMADTKDAELKAAQERIAALEGELKAAQEKVTGFEAEKAKQMAESEYREVSGKVDGLISASVTEGKVTPAMVPALKALAMGDKIPADADGARVMAYTEGDKEASLTWKSPVELVTRLVEVMPKHIDMTEQAKVVDPKDAPPPPDRDAVLATKVASFQSESEKAGRRVSFNEALSAVIAAEKSEPKKE